MSENIPIITNEKNIPFFSRFIFFSPNVIEKNALLPRHNPKITDVKNVISEYDEPTAAKALSPMYFPTTHVSTKL